MSPDRSIETSLEAAMKQLGAEARAAAALLAHCEATRKTEALQRAAEAVRDESPAILEANRRDMAAAKDLSAAMTDRLLLDEKRIAAMAQGLAEVAALPDPVGTELARWTRPNGLDIARVRVPLGVIGIIYESRPNVTADAGGLCLRAGNAAILRGGSESFHSSRAIAAALQRGIASAGLPAASVQLVPTVDRAAVGMMLTMTEAIDIIVPRGGKSLIERVQREARMAVLAHAEGLCHTYVHEAADPAMARAIVANAKMRRTGICGATETLLIDRAIAPSLLPAIVADLSALGCDFRADAAARDIVPSLKPARDADFDTEWLDAVLSIAVVDGVDAALAHIERHGSAHTDAIVTEDADAAERFLRGLDSAVVLWNASTQYCDGGEFGFGAEIGIATGRIHARGPVGPAQLTTYRYIVRGNGQVRP